MHNSPFWLQLSHADRVRLIADELASLGWPIELTEALQEAADELEEMKAAPH